MDENTIRDLQSDFCQVLMAAVHRISGLKRRDLRPAPLEKHGPRLGRADIQIGIFGRIFALTQRHDASGQIDIPLGEQFRYARMLRISGAIDVLGLQLLVDRIFLGNFHHGEYFTVHRVGQRHRLSDTDAITNTLVDRKSDRDRPERAAGQFHVYA